MPKFATIDEDEALASEVIKYKCIYDKNDPGHIEKDRVLNAWAEVEKSLGFEEGINYLILKVASKF